MEGCSTLHLQMLLITFVKQVDNLLVFGEDLYPDSSRGIVMKSFLKNYRHIVNPNLLYVAVTFSSPKPGYVYNLI